MWSPRVAREVTAGAANPYEQAVKLQEYFAINGGFEYDTQVKVGSGSQAIARFLEDKQGFCVHFLRHGGDGLVSLGIPARGGGRLRAWLPSGRRLCFGGAVGRARLALRCTSRAWAGPASSRRRPVARPCRTPRTETPGSSVPDSALPSRNAETEPSAAPSASESCTAQDKKLGACASESAVAVPVTGKTAEVVRAVLAWAAGGARGAAVPAGAVAVAASNT